MRAATALTCVVLLAGRAFAEDAEQPLVGARVRLTTEDKAGKKRLVGELLEEDDHFMKLRLGAGEEVGVPRATVVRVERSRDRGSRGKGAAIGLVTGAVVGGVVGYAAGSSCHGGEWLCFDRSTTVPVTGLALGVLGAGIGAVLGHGERWDDVPASRFRVAIAPALGRGVTARLSFSF